MIVYQALSTYQILECIEHKKHYHCNEEAILILGTYIVEKFPNYKKIAEYEFFDNVYLFNFGGVQPVENKVIETMGQRLKETLPFEISEADKIYIAGIHTYLSVYLIEHNIKFSMFEDGSGALSRPWVLAEITKKSNPAKFELINKYGLYNHTSELIMEKWCNQRTQLKEFEDEKLKHFDITDEFCRLEESDKQHILEFFGVSEKISVSENSVLVLTQQFSNLGQLSFEEHVEIYQYLFDFYLNNINEEIILKLHPDDILYYKKLFPNVRIVRELFPSELLPYVFKHIPHKIVTISSTGIHLIRDKFKEHIEFNPLYEKTFVNDPTYYVTVELLKYINIATVNCWGVNQIQFHNMIQCNTRASDLHMTICEENGILGEVLVIDDFNENNHLLEYCPQNYDAVIYLNSEKKYKMFEMAGKGIFEKLIPLEITIDSNVDKSIISKRSFVIWVQPIKDEVENMIKDYEFAKEMINTGATLKVKSFSGEELEIMRLKGLLEATERRLLDYIEREKQLERELEELRR